MRHHHHHHGSPGCGHSGPLVGEDSPLPLQVFHAFRRAAHAQKSLMMRRMAQKNSHPGQAIMLAVLAREEGITQRDLAEKLSIARPTVNIMLKKLEKAGMVERHADADDQRYTRVRLTEAGRAAQIDMKGAHEGVIEASSASLSSDDQRELVRLLNLMADNIDRLLAADEAERPAVGEDL